MGRRPRLGYPISPPHTGRAYWQRLVPLLSLTVTAQFSSPKVNGSQCRTPSSRIAQIQIKPSVRTQSQCHTLDTAQDHATIKLASHSAFTSAGRGFLVGVVLHLHRGRLRRSTPPSEASVRLKGNDARSESARRARRRSPSRLLASSSVCR